MPGSSKWSLSLRFPHQNPVYTSPLPHTYVPHAPPISFFLIWSLQQYLVSSTDNKAPPYIVFSIFLLCPSSSPNIFINILFSNTLSIRASLNVRDQTVFLWCVEMQVVWSVMTFRRHLSSLQYRSQELTTQPILSCSRILHIFKNLF
jgi:hypothetical protein